MDSFVLSTRMCVVLRYCRCCGSVNGPAPSGPRNLMTRFHLSSKSVVSTTSMMGGRRLLNRMIFFELNTVSSPGRKSASTDASCWWLNQNRRAPSSMKKNPRGPTWSGQVVLPPENDAALPPDPVPGKVSPDLFERSDFDDLLRPGGPAAPAVTVPGGGVAGPPSGAWGTHAEPMMNLDRPLHP